MKETSTERRYSDVVTAVENSIKEVSKLYTIHPKYLPAKGCSWVTIEEFSKIVVSHVIENLSNK